jgi:hypothetical protein
MKNFILNNDIVDLWKDASSPLEYLVAVWITGLAGIAITGWTYLMIRFILNPGMFDHVTWGLIDYIP